MPASKTPAKTTAKKPSRATKASAKTPAAKKAKAKATKKPTPAAKSRAKTAEAKIDRRRDDRRDEEAAAVAAPAAPVPAPTDEASPKLERREKVNRRRQIDPTTCERDYTDSEVEFMNALDDYKRKNGRMFPTCSEVLEVIRDLGYVQLTPAELAARRAEAGVATDDELEASAQRDAVEALGESEAFRAEAEVDA